ncbi:GGDEF domain-containing protein [Sphingomonas bacterium]|uniref:GGDEF domain-containing protein n=1 Tax=Sphingomonas bacterium TaxID=1895847 RepID=UPI001577012A|nr:GGDEF domain-containing protein [Sphingomonas bacterium]
MLKFLDDHRLDHSPDHYTFAHRYLFASDPGFAREVAGIIDGGVRITPSEVMRLLFSASTPTDGAQNSGLDRLTLRFLDIVSDTLAATGTLNRDLVQASSSLLSADVPSIRAVIAAMIDRTTKTEGQLAEATAQAQRLREELNAARDEASRDHLTGLANRGATEERLLELLAREGGCCFAFVDIDRFKAINDAHGHGVGDRVLKAVAAWLSETCAPHHVGRWGGEEFVVLFQRVSLADAVAKIEQARATIGQRQMKLRETDQPLGRVTFSAGIASSRGRSAEQLIAAADALLYQAKSQGRDRTIAEAPIVGV